MNTLELTTAGLFLFLSIFAYGASILLVWAIERFWEWRAGGWPASDWYYRVSWIRGGFYLLSLTASLNFMYRAFEYFLA